MFIHDTENWTSFRWNADTLSDAIARTNRAIGYFLENSFGGSHNRTAKSDSQCLFE